MDEHKNSGSEDSEFVDEKVMEKLRKLKVKTSAAATPLSPRLACIKFWFVVGTAMVLLLWVCVMQSAIMDDRITVSTYYPFSFPAKRIYKNNGYLMVSANGGLNQKRLGISDMVVIARYLNVTLILPEFAAGTYWNDNSTFGDIFDVDHFISSLQGDVRILKDLPPEQKRKVESETLYSLIPTSFSSLTYYDERVLPRVQKHEVLRFAKIDARLANNGLPEELQKLRCQVDFRALKFTQKIEETGRKIVTLLRQKDPNFLALHLRYEKDILAFTGCIAGLTREEAGEVKAMRYSHDGWQHRAIDSKRKRERGSCPLTPEETALTLQGLGIDKNTTVYIAAGETFKKDKRMANLIETYPNMVMKENLLNSSELRPFLNHSDQLAALDYIVALEADIFIPTFVGNMAKAVEGHRRYLGFKTTILPNRKLLVSLIDQYSNGTLTWDEFSLLVKKSHENRMGKPARRTEMPDQPRQEDYFYSNPQECWSPFAEPSIIS